MAAADGLPDDAVDGAPLPHLPAPALDGAVLLEVLIAHHPGLFFVKDAEYRIVAANRNFLHVYPPEQRDRVIGYTTFEQYDPTERALFVEQDRIALTEGFSEVVERLDFPDGQRRTLLTTKAGIDTSAGERLMLGIATDITDLDNSRAELERKSDELAEFAYRTSHDLRAPVVSASALLDLATEMLDAGDHDAARGMIERARNSLGRVEALTDNVAELARIDMAEATIAPVRPAEVIRSAVAEACSRFESVPVEFEYELDDGELGVEQSWFESIVSNFVSNAIKYRDPDRPSSTITVRSRFEESWYVFEVDDEGLGVPDEYRDRLFTQFARLHPTVGDGSGLGLYICRRSAERLGGRIEYEPLTIGSRFRVALPISDRTIDRTDAVGIRAAS